MANMDREQEIEQRREFKSISTSSSKSDKRRIVSSRSAMEEKSNTTTKYKSRNSDTHKETKKKQRNKKFGYFQLFRFASRRERLLQTLGALAALCAGAALPMMTIFLGSTTELFVKADATAAAASASAKAAGNDNTIGPGKGVGIDVATQHIIDNRSLYLVYVALFALVTNALFTFCWVHTGLKLTSRTRVVYLRSLLSQRAEYLDGLPAGKVTEQLSTSFDAMQQGVSEKVGLAIYSASTFVTAFTVALFKDWRLALIMSSVAPAMFLPTGVLAGFQDKFAQRALRYASDAATVAEEMISAIRTTQSLGLPKGLLGRYTDANGSAEAWRIRAHGMHGCIIGTIYFVLFGAYALAFWEGARLFVEGGVSVSDLITVLFVVIIGSFALGQGIRQVGFFSAAVVAGREIFEVIDKEPDYKIREEMVTTPLSTFRLRESIVFDKANFAYPSRPEVPLLTDLNLEIQAEKMTAVVGLSGSGKSTLLSVLTRLYNLDHRCVLLDGIDHRAFNTTSLRSMFAVVGQDTAIFEKSILDNVLDGVTGKANGRSRKELKAMVVAACKVANAHDFIRRLPEGYHTLVGSRGSSLSGGQRQRLAIARAIISVPQILILDEATSALDTVAEEAVIKALRNLMQHGQITVIVIAHRLSSIIKADKIAVLDQGRLVETGSHRELLNRKSAYHRLWQIGQQADMTNEEQISRVSCASIISDMALDEGSSYLGEGSVKMPSRAKSYRNIITELAKQPERRRESGVLKTSLMHEAFNLLRTNKREWPRMFAGIFFSFVCGATYPLQALIFTHLLLAFGNPDRSSLQGTADKFCLEFFCVAVLKFLAHYGSITQFGICKERMISSVRTKAFQAILKKPIEWFENEVNSTTALVSTLARCSDLEAIHVATMGLYFAVVVSLLGGSITSFVFAWPLAFITTATIPLFLVSAYLRYKLLSAFSSDLQGDYLKAAGLASEATSSSIRTVALLRLEDQIVRDYRTALEAADGRSNKNVTRLSLLFGVSQSATFFINALVIWSGAKLISGKHIDTFGFFVAFISISFGAQDAGELFSYAPHLSRARSLSQQLMGILSNDRGDRPLPVPPGPAIAEHVISGEISFRSVSFSYPRRPTAKVLRGVNLNVAAGQHIALVGESGSGKSTVIGLLERYYEPSSGQVLVDGQDIRNYEIENYRSSIGLVSQDPVLYDGTVAFNILLASNGKVTQARLEEACEKANILQFIQSLPEGFETQVGSRGVKLSGGQKQRIVIARVLLQDASICLLDEATSALDFQSEAVVQEALDRAMVGKTTITVAYRLSTIQRADCIYVFDRGWVVESGTHEDLVELHRRYWRMLKRS